MSKVAKATDNFLKIKRQKQSYRSVSQRKKNYKDVSILREWNNSQEQASRCMDCGTPFCHWACPLGNYIPEWNSLMHQGRWADACKLLEDSNSMPEVTGRVCPAFCEFSCVLGINDEPVTIRENELGVVEYGFKRRLIRPRVPRIRTGKRVGIIGSGPAGLSAASWLNQAGHSVVVWEKSKRLGGILRYGIPDFKLEKWILDRRINLWKKEGIAFKTNQFVGEKYLASALVKNFDSLLIAIGSQRPRNLNLPGRQLSGIYFAMDFLVQSNKQVSGEDNKNSLSTDLSGKHVVVIGGGDTGSDCVGTANRQKAAKVTQIEILPKPPQERPTDCPWPNYPQLLKTSTSHQEGCVRIWATETIKFTGEKGKVKKISCVKVEFSGQSNSLACLRKVSGTEFEIKADVVILALGFIGPSNKDVIQELGVKLDSRGNIQTNLALETSVPKVFSAGDSRTGQSLVALAIADGRRAAECMNLFLKQKNS